MSSVFSNYAKEVENRLAVPEINIAETVDEFTFVTSSDYLCEDPTPLQSTIIKTLYGLWPLYPPTKDEILLLETLKRNWGLVIDLESKHNIQFLVLVLGRRSSKCVSYDTIITDANTGYQYKIGDLYNNQELRPTIFTLNNSKKFKKTKQYTVLYQGVRDVYEVVTNTGRRIEVTDNEPFLTLTGWKQLKELKIEDMIAVPSKYEKLKIKKIKIDITLDWNFIKEINYKGKKPTYDLSVEKTHNYIANDIVVHNSSSLSFLASIGAYKLICKGNPQKYYRIRERQPITIMHIAAAGKQAASVFTLTSDNIKKVPFFRPYIDFDKDNTTELRMFTPHDLMLNQKIKQRNALLGRGMMKENTLPGSIYIKSITTSAASSRGDAVYMLLFSEFAHFEWAKFDINDSSESILEANPSTDYAVNTALTPSVLDFGEDGKIVYESSPSVKGGEFYHQYCIGGGREQEIKEGEIIKPEPGYQVIQLATWEARPTFTRDSPLIVKAFNSNPRGANMEYGAHFGDPSGQFITEAVIKSIPKPGIFIIRKNPSNWKFILSLDPGGRAKKKKADTYALSWGHYEQKSSGEDIWYFIDGMQGWDEEIKLLSGGKTEKILVDPNVVTNYVLELIRDLGGRNYILEIVYDQWNSAAPVSTLQSLGMPALETTFTNVYKSEMYGAFLTEALRGHVSMYGEDEGGWIYRWTQ